MVNPHAGIGPETTTTLSSPLLLSASKSALTTKRLGQSWRFFGLVVLLAGLMGSLLTSCQQGGVVYEDHKLLGESGWYQDSIATFPVTVPKAGQPYNLYFFVRHTLDYPYSNIYIRDSISTLSGKLISSEQQQFYLAHPVTGRPYGSGLAEVRDILMLARENVKFDSAGTYQVKLQQYMRVSPLPNILTVGVKLIEVEQR